MRAAGAAFHAAGVGAVYLVHGTFAGTDATGMLTELGRVYPAAQAVLGRLAKMLFDLFARDDGNYTAEYAERLEAGLAAPDRPRIPVRLFDWSSENHHIGRADAAVRLVDELSSLDLPAGARILLWGHSHGGNVLALLTNLLSGNAELVTRFFAAARWYYRLPLVDWVDIPVWRDVEHELLTGPRLLDRHPLDLVTFGTPVRYGWNRDGYSQLLHFINHRPTPGLPPHRVPFPPTIDDVLQARAGDYIQQFGIAGTNTVPNLLAWRALVAEGRLQRLLESPEAGGGLTERLRQGMRVPEEGQTLLVDYGPPEGNIAQHLAGHAVYTRQEWMLFHAEEIARRLYGPAGDK